jgi:MYXO-CTERM domain-containing protein
MTKLLSLLAILTLATTLAFSQAADRPATTDRDANAPTATRTDEARNDHDWGWIGLIGLAGLAGLAGRRKREEMRGRERDVTKIRSAA